MPPRHKLARSARTCHAPTVTAPATPSAATAHSGDTRGDGASARKSASIDSNRAGGIACSPRASARRTDAGTPLRRARNRLPSRIAASSSASDLPGNGRTP